MVRKSKQEAAATRAALLQAAARVFEARGVANAGLAEIAAAAGVTRGAVYWHFKNKPDLFFALYESVYAPFAEMVLKDLEQDHPRPLVQLERLCTQLFGDFVLDTEKQKLLSVFFLNCDYSGELAEVRARQNARKGKSVEMFYAYFQRARERGHLAEDAEPRVLALSLTSYFTGLTYEFLRNPEVFTLGEYAPFVFRHFFRGIARAAD